MQFVKGEGKDALKDLLGMVAQKALQLRNRKRRAIRVGQLKLPASCPFEPLNDDSFAGFVN